MSRTRIIIALSLLLPVMFLSWLTMTPNGLRWLFLQAEFYLPMELSMDKIEGKLIGPITVSGVEYQQDGVIIKADQLVFDWRPSSLLLANIDIEMLHLTSLSVALPESEKAEPVPGQTVATTLPEIHLPWRLLLKDGEINGLSIKQGEQAININKLRLKASTLFSEINIKELIVTAETYSADIKGELRPTHNYRHDLAIHWQTRLPSDAIIEGQGQVKGDMEKTRLTQRLQGPLQLIADVQLNDILSQLSWQAKIDATQFDLAQLDSSWPAFSGAVKFDAQGDLSTAKVTGKLQGKYPELGDLDAAFNLQRLSDNTIQIDQLKLHLAETDTTIDSSGSWLPAANGGDVALSLNWQKLRWPLQQPAWFNSSSGYGAIAGNIDRYEIKLTTDSPWPELLASTWHASATGNADGMAIKSLRIEALNGETNVTGQLNWSPELTWTADISASGIDPASLLPEWPGQLNGKISTKGHMRDGQLIAEADINQIKGKLRNYPVSLRSHLRWQNEQLAISQLKFRSGKSLVKIDGSFGDTLHLNWAIDSSNLAELYPETKGRLQASGLVSGPQRTPTVEASLNGKTLRYLNYEIAAIDGKLAVDLFHWQQMAISLTAQSLRLNDYELQSLTIDADNQLLTAKSISKNVNAVIALKGKPVDNGWQGHIEQISVQSQYFDNWRIDAPVAVSLTEESIIADAVCLNNDRDASLCATVGRQGSAWNSRIDATKLPLKLLTLWLPSELKLEGVANATADVKLILPDELVAQVNIELPSSTIYYPLLEGDDDRLAYRNGAIQLSLDAAGLNAKAELIMASNDRFLARLELPGFKPLATVQVEQPMKAGMQVDASDLRVLESLIPEIHNLQGELKLSLNASGTLDHPLLSGHGELINGSVQIPKLGLEIEKLSLNSRSDNYNKLNFHLDARSGGGKLAIDGNTRLDRIAGWPTEINIKGDQFEVSSIPEARVMASPDLKIKMKNRTIDVTGDVLIPYAKLQPKDITQAATTSGDTVIIGGEELPEEKWLINTSVRVTLGERVHFYGFGFEGRLGGSLLLQDEPGQLTRATGEINIPEGNYRAYGQRLEVENGRILFTGGPLTNPGLDIRAVRKVGDVTAGLNVKGSLSHPQLEIFSTPTMSQTDALAYLVLGRPLESADSEDGNKMAKAALALGLMGGDTIARGLGDRFGLDEMRVESSDSGDQASLVVGRYLSPKLYASYGVGLIESVNTITLRYQISNKWQIKAESGEAQGADILYTFER